MTSLEFGMGNTITNTLFIVAISDKLKRIVSQSFKETGPLNLIVKNNQLKIKRDRKLDQLRTKVILDIFVFLI